MKKLNPGAEHFVMNNMNVSNNYVFKKKVQTVEERKRSKAEKVKKAVQKRKDLVALK